MKPDPLVDWRVAAWERYRSVVIPHARQRQAVLSRVDFAALDRDALIWHCTAHPDEIVAHYAPPTEGPTP